MLDLIKKLLGASWITTALGWIGTALGVSIVGWHNPDGTVNWIVVAMAIVGAVLARRTKDISVTGGQVAATIEAVDRIQTKAPAAVTFMATPKEPTAKAEAAAVHKAEK